MMNTERKAYAANKAGKPGLQAGMLSDDKGLGKTITVLALVYLLHKMVSTFRGL